MNVRALVILLFFFGWSCQNSDSDSDNNKSEEIKQISFDPIKWQAREGNEFPFRSAMYTDLMNDDSIRSLNQADLLSLLGEPLRINEGHLYYRIEESNLGMWTLHAKTLVIKYKDEEKLEWMKIHE